jgi:hypothetical protein
VRDKAQLIKPVQSLGKMHFAIDRTIADATVERSTHFDLSGFELVEQTAQTIAMDTIGKRELSGRSLKYNTSLGCDEAHVRRHRSKPTHRLRHLRKYRFMAGTQC